MWLKRIIKIIPEGLFFKWAKWTSKREGELPGSYHLVIVWIWSTILSVISQKFIFLFTRKDNFANHCSPSKENTYCCLIFIVNYLYFGSLEHTPNLEKMEQFQRSQPESVTTPQVFNVEIHILLGTWQVRKTRLAKNRCGRNCY